MSARIQSYLYGQNIVPAGPHGSVVVDLPADQRRAALLLKVLEALCEVVAEECGLAGVKDEDPHALGGGEGDLDTRRDLAAAGHGSGSFDLCHARFAEELHLNLSCVSEPGVDAESPEGSPAPSAAERGPGQ